MNLFHDTNVLIAYCFIQDRWKGKAEAILKDDFTHFTSDKVINEFLEKEDEIIKDFYSKIVNLSERIYKSGKDNFNVDEKNKIIKKADKEIRPLIAEFLDKKVTYPVSKKILAESLQNLYFEGLKTERARYENLRQKFKEIHCRLKEYPKLESQLEQLGIHNGNRDRGILLDAHDLAILKGFTLNFVSLDDDLCQEFRNEILNLLELNEIIDLRYYSGF